MEAPSTPSGRAGSVDLAEFLTRIRVLRRVVGLEDASEPSGASTIRLARKPDAFRTRPFRRFLARLITPACITAGHELEQQDPRRTHQ
jgi:hypothetical protein